MTVYVSLSSVWNRIWLCIERKLFYYFYRQRQDSLSFREIRMHGTESEAFVRRIWDSYLGKEKDGSRGNFEDEVTMEYEVELKL